MPWPNCKTVLSLREKHFVGYFFIMMVCGKVARRCLKLKTQGYNKKGSFIVSQSCAKGLGFLDLNSGQDFTGVQIL